jgi:L-aspartate oxidase
MSTPVIMGAGLAGLSAALALAPQPVLLVSPRKLGEGCSSAWAQGGIAAAVGADDTAALHTKDTLAAGAGINDAAVVDQVTQDGKTVIDRLAAFGVAFDRDAAGTLKLGLEAAHSKRRIVHAADATGLAVTNALIAAARAAAHITLIEDATAHELLTNANGICGIVLRCGDQLITIHTSAVILATGGCAALWRDTTNPHENWGGGLALAARAGATLGDLEFMQFHPTAIDIGRDPMPLASEALRGEGAVLINETGKRFTEELQPRDIVTRAIWGQLTQGHRVFLDARQALGSDFIKRFPTIHALCASAGIDPAITPIPVRPAAHYHMGGVVTDANGRTDIPGLWACGEVACTGLHGANRLASNSLLEAASFGQRVAQDVAGHADRGARGAEESKAAPPRTSPETHGKIRAIMSDYVGVIRDQIGLEKALAMLEPLASVTDSALVALMITRCALQRQESRGAHYRSDFPHLSPTAQRTTFRL